MTNLNQYTNEILKFKLFGKDAHAQDGYVSGDDVCSIVSDGDSSEWIVVMFHFLLCNLLFETLHMLGGVLREWDQRETFVH